MIPECRLARMLYDKAVNSAQTASVVTVTPNFYLTTQIGRDWLAAMRAKLDLFEAETGIQAVLVGPGAVRHSPLRRCRARHGIGAWGVCLPAPRRVSGVVFGADGVQDSADTIDAVFAAFPIMISVTCGLVLVVMGVAFRSILIPLRSVVTISLSLMFTFGLANLTCVGCARQQHRALCYDVRARWLTLASACRAGMSTRRCPGPTSRAWSTPAPSCGSALCARSSSSAASVSTVRACMHGGSCELM